jgi:hypothetical protein
MEYVGHVIRPPSEADSIILQVTVGCSYNKCTFCGAYKDISFTIKDEATIIQDLQFAGQYCRRQHRVFLADGDVLILSQKRLIRLFQLIHHYLPWISRISLYGNARAIRSKSHENLQELKALGLDRVYMGLESGCNEILQSIRKGESAETMIAAATKQPPTRSRWVCTSRTESPAIPASAGLFYVKTIIGVFFKMMRQIFVNHFFREFSGGNAEISSRPEMTTPVSFLYHREFLENFSSNPPLDSSHDVSGRDIGWCRNQDVDMILADDTSQDLNLELFTCLPNQFAHPQGEVSLKHMVAVLGYPNKMVLNLEFCMTALAIIHAADYKPTASRMLPA